MRKIGLLSLACSATFLVGLIGSSKAADEKNGDYVRINAVETIAETEKWVKKLVNSGVKMALPYVMSTVTEVNLNPSCMRGLLKMLRGVMDIKDWAVRSKCYILSFFFSFHQIVFKFLRLPFL